MSRIKTAIMAKIGIFYGSSFGNTEHIAREIQHLLGIDNADLINVRNASEKDFNHYEYLVFGCSTEEEGQIQKDWETKLPIIRSLDFTNKKVALFSLGDQKHHPDTFVDGMGILYQILSETEADIIGNWYPHGYIFNKSKAFINGSFVGLALDEEFQPAVTKTRLQKWTDYLKSQFKLHHN